MDWYGYSLDLNLTEYVWDAFAGTLFIVIASAGEHPSTKTNIHSGMGTAISTTVVSYSLKYAVKVTSNHCSWGMSYSLLSAEFQ